jgi:hypothetical protein
MDRAQVREEHTMRNVLIVSAAMLCLSMSAPIAFADQGGIPNANAGDHGVGYTGENSGIGLAMSSEQGRVDNGYGNGGEPFEDGVSEVAETNDRGDADAYRPCKIEKWC